MIPETRRELIQILSELSEQFPDMRLGQLVSNLAMASRGADASATWDVEDKELLKAARRWLADRSVVSAE
ncbi:MAG: hypothetical protein KDA52_05680 [Planctomycetaceae bacterium]|nr:hypothetical protein [Planctomycetaceae bacterium]